MSRQRVPGDGPKCPCGALATYSGRCNYHLENPLMTMEEDNQNVRELLAIGSGKLDPPVYVGPIGGESRAAEERMKLTPVYMMHPLGNGPDRERNRKLACLWQAAIQRAHPEWVVLAPWIGLSGAWGEDLRDLGMKVDFATIDLCEGGVIAGPLDGPVRCLPVREGLGDGYSGVSPCMSEELQYFWSRHPSKPIHDVRSLYSVSLPPEAERPRFKPRFVKFEQVYVENKPGGVCAIKDIDEPAPGVFRYLIERTETFFAHEQAIAKKT